MKRRDILKALGFAAAAPALVRSMIVDAGDIIQDVSQTDELIEKTLNGYALLNLYHQNKLFATGQEAKIIYDHPIIINNEAFYPGPNGVSIQFNDLSSLDKALNVYMNEDLISFKIVQDEHFLSGDGYLTDLELTSPGAYKKSVISGAIRVYGAVYKEIIT